MHASAQGEETRATFREVHLGLEVRLELVGDTARLERIARRAFDRIDSLDLILSDWRAESALRRLELAPVGRWVSVPRELAEVLWLANSVARATDGAFDPTIGALTRLWREAARTGKPIDAAARRRARALVDYRVVTVDTVQSRVRVARAGVRFDLGAIAKGWILDALIVQLRAEHVDAALIEAGGDIAVFTAIAAWPAWRIRVERASGDTVLMVRDGAVSTSGPSAQSLFRRDGRGESHVMRPSTGMGLRDGQQVTVMGARAALTDALATAMTLLPRAKGEDLAHQFGVQVMGRTSTRGDLR
ncbi:MAG: FAD:protein FMN transferase [Gemmatimonadaceae bacterium]|nr:FAD:protein FMN transferase [Gemmatimonadaceae bacterium]